LAFINDKIDNILCGARRKRFAPQFILQRKSPLCLTKFEVGKKDSRFFCKKALTKEGVFGIIVKRAGETDKRDRKNSGERTLKTI